MAKLVLREDGVDHVRVSVDAATATGRLCAMGFSREFEIPGIGTFLSPGLFAIWTITGKNSLQSHRNIPKIEINEEAKKIYKDALWLGKFLQLYCASDILLKDAKVVVHKAPRIDLPFCEYKVHKNGLKEMLADQRNVELAKAMVKFIIKKDVDGEKGHFEYGDFKYIDVLAKMNRLLQARHEKVRFDIKLANILESIHQGHETLARRAII